MLQRTSVSSAAEIVRAEMPRPFLTFFILIQVFDFVCICHGWSRVRCEIDQY